MTPPSKTLQERIRASVAAILEQMASDGSWRCYSGPKQTRLIEAVCEVAGAEHAGLASSGTAALEMVLHSLELSSEDEVMLSGYDYPGNFAAIERVGARPVLIDIEPGGWRLGVERLETAYSSRCKVLIASHLHGQLQPIAQLHCWCQAHGVRLIHDACQALGASIEGQALATWGDVTLLSFGGTKVISAGRGGAWVTRDARLALLARRAAGVGSGTYEMSELQASLVLAQLPFLDEITQCCRQYFEAQHARLIEQLPDAVAPWWPHRNQSAFYQAGWILPEGVTATSASLAGDWSDLLGVGFQGFHKRSSRRARLPEPLVNVERVVARTATIHHRAAVS